MLVTFIVLYLLVSIGIGLFAATRVHNTADYAVAGRSLPLAVVIATTFATWFGSETVLGVSARFVDGGLGAVVEDPFGASMCLVLVGLFFAYKLYQKNLITLGDYYRQRYGRSVEVLCSLIIIFSYLGWVAAQITALGLVFNLLTQGALSITAGMVLGTAVVLIYTLYGGMWSVALTDFVQMIVIAVGLIAIAWFAADLAGGAGKVVEFAAREGKFNFFPQQAGFKEWTFFFAAAITMMLGSIPQQDVFQRVMSSNSAETARIGPVVGGRALPAVCFHSHVCGHFGGADHARDGAGAAQGRPAESAAHAGHGAHAAGVANRFLWRFAVGHHVHGVGHAAGAIHHVCREHLAQPAPGHERCAHPQSHACGRAGVHGLCADLCHHHAGHIHL